MHMALLHPRVMDDNNTMLPPWAEMSMIVRIDLAVSMPVGESCILLRLMLTHLSRPECRDGATCPQWPAIWSPE